MNLSFESWNGITRSRFRNKFIRAKRLCKFGQGFGELFPGNCFAVPAVLVLQQRHAFPLERPGYESARLVSAVSLKRVERVDDLGVVVAIDSLSEPTKGTKLLGEAIH